MACLRMRVEWLYYKKTSVCVFILGDI